TQAANQLRVAISRYNADGSLDTNFGSGGRVISSFTGFDQPKAIAVGADGKIVIAGISTVGDADIIVARYNSNGTLDTSFGGGSGFVQIDLQNSSDDDA